MKPFKLVEEADLYQLLSSSEIEKLKGFQAYLFEARSTLNSQAVLPSLDEAYNTAWKLGFRDFSPNITNLYGFDYDEEYYSYTNLCRAGLDNIAQLKWKLKFGDELELPTHPSFWAKKK